jgi:hypothetical protein
MYQTSFKFYDLEPVQLELDFKMPEHLELDVNMDTYVWNAYWNDLSYSFSYTLPSDENWNRQLIYSSIMNNYDKT